MPQESTSTLPADLLLSVLQRGLRNDNIIVTNVVTTIPTSLAGEHYMSKIEYCDVDIDIDGVAKQVHLFVKKETHDDMMGDMSKIVFDREILLYDVLMKDVVDFCGQKVDTSFIPVCFHTGKSGNELVIVMENLLQTGYKMHADKTASQDLRHAKLVLKSLATFHAITFALQKKGGVDLSDKLNILGEIEQRMAPVRHLISSAVTVGVNVVKNMPNCNRLASKLEKFASTASDAFIEFLLPAKDGINVVCHGDCWNNNMMFLYDENEKPLKVKLVDWQGIHYGPIGKDICHYLYMSVKPELRKKSLSMLLHIYYDKFRGVLEALGAEDAMFSYEEFTREYKSCKLFGLIAGSMTAGMTTVMAEMEKIKAQDSQQTFDVNYLVKGTEDPRIVEMIPAETKQDLIDMVKDCEEELDAYLARS